MKKRFPIIPELDPELDEQQQQTHPQKRKAGSSGGRKRKKRKSAQCKSTILAGKRTGNTGKRKLGRTL